MNARIIVGAALAAFGIGWAILTVRPWAHPAGPRPVPPQVNPTDIAAAHAANPSSTTDLVTTLVSFEQSLESAFAALPPETALDVTIRQTLTTLARERLELLLDPSYDDYLVQAARLTRQRIDPDRLKDLVMDKAEWELYAKHFRALPLDLNQVEIRPVYKLGTALPQNWAGGTTVTYPPKGLYSSFRSERLDANTHADVYEVWIPAQINDADTGRPAKVFLVMGFVRFPPSDQWVPWRIGFNDPAGEAAMITPPI